MKTCSKCHELLPLELFNNQLRGLFGKRSVCKGCMKKYMAEYDRKRYEQNAELRESIKIQAAKWVKENPEKRKAIVKRRHKKVMATTPEKRWARQSVHQRVRRGLMPRVTTLKCECGAQAQHYHHHKGYAKEFRNDVVPVCVKCHIILG